MENLTSVNKYVNDRYSDLMSSMFIGMPFKGRWKVISHEENLINVYEMFFDDEFICSFTDKDSNRSLDLKVLQGFKSAYEAGLVYLSPDMREEAIKQDKVNRIVKQELARKDRDKDLAKLSTDEKEIAHKVSDKVSKKG